MKRIFIFLVLAIGFTVANAQCISCWELRKVEITMKTGQSITGYVKWNEVWLNGVLDTAVWKNRFPESLLPYYENLGYKWDLEFITEIFVIRNDSIPEFYATKAVSTGNLDYTKIQSVRELDKGSENYHGVGDIQIFSQAEIDKLKRNPVAVLFYTSAYFGNLFSEL